MQDSNFIDFNRKWVVLSGASSGIGKAIAQQLNALGANLIVIGRSRDALEQLSLNLSQDRCKTLCLDLNNIGDIQPALQKTLEETGKIYGFCHSAGTVTTMPLNASKHDLVSKMMLVNFHAGLEIARVVSGRRVMEESGSMVFISSIYARVGAAGQIAYCASKGAVVSAVRAMAVELARRRIRVNSVSPGFVTTKMTEKATSQLNVSQVDAILQKHPLGPGSPEDVARAVAFLLAPQNKWITGTDFVLDGGFTA
jgi:NAD(P)-dependent dehydrogenase (short-subunit alcohol dehydrogenase family)